MIKELVLKNRSYRRFDNSHKIASTTLIDLLELVRHTASAANLQPLKFRIVNTVKENEAVFKSLGWAGYLSDWDGPVKEERPSAYMLLLTKNVENKYVQCDAGLAMQSLLLGACEQGLGGCIFASVKRDRLKKDLNIPAEYEILYVVALGKPIEKIVVDEIQDEKIKYWRDKDQVHHVPKRKIEDLML